MSEAVTRRRKGPGLRNFRSRWSELPPGVRGSGRGGGVTWLFHTVVARGGREVKRLTDFRGRTPVGLVTRHQQVTTSGY